MSFFLVLLQCEAFNNLFANPQTPNFRSDNNKATIDYIFSACAIILTKVLIQKCVHNINFPAILRRESEVLLKFIF
jgi:hypothetical protein